jgi:hypothetical protein
MLTIMAIYLAHCAVSLNRVVYCDLTGCAPALYEAAPGSFNVAALKACAKDLSEADQRDLKPGQKNKP